MQTICMRTWPSPEALAVARLTSSFARDTISLSEGELFKSPRFLARRDTSIVTGDLGREDNESSYGQSCFFEFKKVGHHSHRVASQAAESTDRRSCWNVNRFNHDDDPQITHHHQRQSKICIKTCVGPPFLPVSSPAA